MATKMKAFDCVKMKRRIQESIVAKYEKSKAELSFILRLLEGDRI